MVTVAVGLLLTVISGQEKPSDLLWLSPQEFTNIGGVFFWTQEPHSSRVLSLGRRKQCQAEYRIFVQK